MAKITVRPVGRRAVGRPHCVVCGATRQMGRGVCQHACHWLLPGWIAWNAVLKEIKFTDHRALPLARLHKWDPKTGRRSAPSFPKIVAIARTLGWSGDTTATSQPTFINAEVYA